METWVIESLTPARRTAAVESPPATIEVSDVEFTIAGRVVNDEDESLFWSYWNDGIPAINLQLWFS